jgi:hypothetical protein
MSSRTYEAGVKGTSEGYICCALNEGAAVGEQSDGVGWTLEPQKEVIEADIAVGSETIPHGVEVDGTMVFVDLHGVSAAKGDMGTALSSEMREDALAADGAGGIWSGGVDFAASAGPEIEGQKGPSNEMGLIGKEFEGFCDLDRGGEVDGSAEDASGVAGFYGSGRGLGEDAG